MKFIFKGYDSNIEKGEVFFHFGFKGEKNIDFMEKISFPPVATKIPQALLKSILDNLMIILGISYWKLYCPEEIIIERNFLTKEQASFWNTVYTKGLGEFFYKNKIDFRGLINFLYVENSTSSSTPVKQASSSFQSSAPGKDRALLGLGGGKDSIVSSEMLKSQNKPFDVFTVGMSLIQEQVVKIMGKKPIVIMRHLDPKLFELNKTSNVYNGHIPISVIYAFLGLMASVLYDYSFVIVGNDRSANYGNVEYLGEMINHQWSKSEEFEALFKEYIKKFIALDVSYFSMLRNMNELKVTKEFVKYPKYFKVFSSCNRNFKILKPFFAKASAVRRVQDNTGGKWCGKCAKCLFVFTLLSAFLSKKQVLDIFGKNLFCDQSLLSLFEELIGVRNFKPFECVGTPEEVKIALNKTYEKGEFDDTFLMKHFIPLRNHFTKIGIYLPELSRRKSA